MVAKTAKKTAKKIAKKAPAKKVAKKIATKVAKAPVKKVAKKTAKKVAKKTTKKVAAKAPAKAPVKAAKKIAKKVTKKTPAAKVVKTKSGCCCEHAVTKKVAKPAAKAAPATKPAVVRDATKPLNKSQIIALIAEKVGVEKKKVFAILDTLTDIIAKELKKPGLFQLPGLIKIEKKTIPAQKAIKDWKNPFTGEIGTKPAKPASTKVKVRALKKLKDMA